MKTKAGNQFASKLSGVFKRIESAAMGGVGTSVEVIAGEIVPLAPRDTGDTAAAVDTTDPVRVGDVISATVVIATPGVGSIEYGDRNQAAQPFARPGFDASKDNAVRSIVAPIVRAI